MFSDWLYTAQPIGKGWDDLQSLRNKNLLCGEDRIQDSWGSGVGRDPGGRRDYREADVEWVKFIKRLKDTGMLLRDIKYYSDLRYAGDQTMPERMELLLWHRSFVEEQQRKWEEYRKNLDDKIEIYRARGVSGGS